MTATYKIENVEQLPGFEGSYGPMNVFRLALKAADGTVQAVEMNQKPATPAPTVGQEVTGDVTPATNPKFLAKFKKAQQAFNGGGGPRPRDPKEGAQIIQQHSQGMALRYCELQQQRGKLPEGFNVEQVLLLAAKFAEDAKAATP